MKRLMLQCLAVTSFLLSLMLVASSAMSSPGWIRTYPGEEMDMLTPSSMVQTTDGGYATAINAELRRVDNVGYPGHFTQSFELQILKTDQNGGVQWKHSYPTVEDPNHAAPTIYTYSENYAIVQTADHGYVVAGGNFWMFKVDSQGSVLWSKTYQLNDEYYGSSIVYSMIQTRDAGFSLVGSVETVDEGIDFWLVKTDSLGVAQWNQTYNSGTYTDSYGNVNPRDDVAECVIQTNDGGYAMVGSASLFNSGTSSITYSAWVVKTDSQGNQLWNKGYDLLNLPSQKSIIIQTSDDGYAIAGNQNNDFCLFTISSTSQFQWSKFYGDTETDTPCSLVQLEDGGYAIAGTWTPTTNTTLIRPIMGLLRADSNGQTLWIKTYSAKQNETTVSTEYAKAMVRTNDGSYALVGDTQFGSETHRDIFFVKTETLEQPPQTTPIPSPATPGPTTNPTPTQTSQPTSNPNQTPQPQTPSSSDSPNTPSNPNILPISQEQTLLIIGAISVAVVVSVTLIIMRAKRKKIDQNDPNLTDVNRFFPFSEQVGVAP